MVISEVLKLTITGDDSEDLYCHIPNNHTCMGFNFVEYCPVNIVLFGSVCLCFYMYIPPAVLVIVQSKVPTWANFPAWAIVWQLPSELHVGMR